MVQIVHFFPLFSSGAIPNHLNASSMYCLCPGTNLFWSVSSPEGKRFHVFWQQINNKLRSEQSQYVMGSVGLGAKRHTYFL
jgi:hypothetical protein